MNAEIVRREGGSSINIIRRESNKSALLKTELQPPPETPTINMNNSYNCLICGKLKTFVIGPDGERIEIKEETVEAADFNNEFGDAGVRSIKTEENQGDPAQAVTLFRFFYKSMKLKKKIEWDFKSEAVPLCRSCRGGIFQIKAIEEEIRELERRLKMAWVELKERMKKNEPKFQAAEVYQKDNRYFYVRSNILGIALTHPTYQKQIHRKRPYEIAKKGTRQQSKTEENIPEKSSAVKDMPMPDEAAEDDTSYHHEFEDPSSPVESPPQAETAISADEEETTTIRPRRMAAKRAKASISTVVKAVADDDEEVKSKNVTPEVKEKKWSSELSAKPDDLDDDDDDDEWEEEKVPILRTNRDSRRRMKNTDTKSLSHLAKPFRKQRFDEETGKYGYLHVQYETISPREYKCEICGEIIEKQHITHHARNRHLTRACPHPYCDFEAANKETTEDHFIIYHDKAGYKHHACPVCGKPRSKNRLHRLSHLNEDEKAEAKAAGKWSKQLDEVECDECGKMYKNSQVLRMHKVKNHNYPPAKVVQKRETTGNETHLCSECGTTCESQQALKKHRRKKHPDPQELRFVCIHCDKRFRLESHLRKHKIIHSDECPFVCNQCPRTFKSADKLKKHQIVHGERNFQCEQCPMAFFSIAHLNGHIKRYHSEGSKPGRSSYIRGPDKKGYRKMTTNASAPKQEAKKSDQETDSHIMKEPPGPSHNSWQGNAFNSVPGAMSNMSMPAYFNSPFGHYYNSNS